MKVARKQTIDTELFELGDEIRFKLTTGEKVRAKAVQECEDGMLFITKDCVEKEMPVYKNVPKVYSDYIHSDLRKYLNSELLSFFPEKIRSRMVPMMIKDSCRDCLRVPTEKEIFGENTFGVEERYTEQFYGMKDCHNRVAFAQDELQWYWLQNRVSSEAFAFVNHNGAANCVNAYACLGVRLVFKLKNKNKATHE
ncbi:MAG: DUF6273 domain-containing protein [Lachnospiraceae bacterium]|nr:DUF6273 domain-containing protein [Lachnospiraceae bacterium]MCI6766869.1 DUF6273 domain-containing protein [Lachnospiraceae bacterium]